MAGMDPLGLNAGVVWYRGENLTTCTPDATPDSLTFFSGPTDLIDTWPDASGEPGDRTLVQPDPVRKPGFFVAGNRADISPFEKDISFTNRILSFGAQHLGPTTLELAAPLDLHGGGETGLSFSIIASPRGLRGADTLADLVRFESSASGDYIQLQFTQSPSSLTLLEDIEEGSFHTGRSIKLGAEVFIGGSLKTLESDQYVVVQNSWWYEFILLVDYVRGYVHLLAAPLFRETPLRGVDFATVSVSGSAPIFDNIIVGGDNQTKTVDFSIIDIVMFNKYLRNDNIRALDRYYRRRYETIEPGIPSNVTAVETSPSVIKLTWDEEDMPKSNTHWNGMDVYRANTPDFLTTHSNLRSSGILPGVLEINDSFNMPTGIAVYYRVGPCLGSFRGRTAKPAVAFPGFTPTITSPIFYSLGSITTIEGNISLLWLVRFLDHNDILTTDVELYFDTSPGVTSGTGTLLGTFPWNQNGVERVINFLHTGLTPSVTYYYIIRAITTLGPAPDGPEHAKVAVGPITSCT
jgi:hypothetical protein